MPLIPTRTSKPTRQSLGLDMNRFREDLNAESTKNLIMTEKAKGSAAGIDHTPVFAINGSNFVPRDVDDFKALIDAALE